MHPTLPTPVVGPRKQGTPAFPRLRRCTPKAEVTAWQEARVTQAEHAAARDGHNSRPCTPKGRSSVPCRQLTLPGPPSQRRNKARTMPVSRVHSAAPSSCPVATSPRGPLGQRHQKSWAWGPSLRLVPLPAGLGDRHAGEPTVTGHSRTRGCWIYGHCVRL